MDVRIAGPADYRHAAEVLACAFYTYQMNCYLFPDPAERLSQLQWLYHRATMLYASVGGAFITSDGSGVALWTPPQYSRGLGAGRYVRAGFLMAPFHLGLNLPRRRIRALLDIGRRQHAEITGPHWSLEVLGVDPEQQRTGAGAALLRHVLGLADQEGHPAYVITHELRNVAYYERHGFQSVAQAPFEPGAPPTCSLLRPAAVNP